MGEMRNVQKNLIR